MCSYINYKLSIDKDFFQKRLLLFGEKYDYKYICRIIVAIN